MGSEMCIRDRSGRREQEAARGLQEAQEELEKAKAETYALQVTFPVSGNGPFRCSYL